MNEEDVIFDTEPTIICQWRAWGKNKLDFYIDLYYPSPTSYY